MTHFLAIDLGASSGRAMLGTLSNGRLELEEVHRFENGGVELNGQLFWNILGLFGEIKTGIRKALAKGITLSGIAVDTWGVDFVLLDRDGNLAGLPYHYRSPHTNEVFDWVFDRVPRDAFYRSTGTQFMSINTIFQLATLQRNDSAALAIAERMLMIPNALTNMLCGDVSTEYTIATTSQALDATTGDWAWELIDALGLPRKLFPPIKKSGTVVGNLTPAICTELNCDPVPVILSGGHDTAAAVAAVPAQAGDEDWAFLSSGTWSLLGVTLDKPCLTEAALAANFTNEGCMDGKIRFLKNIMGLWLVQESRATWRRQGQEYSFAKLEELAAAATPFKALVDPNCEDFAAPGDMPARIQAFCERTGQPIPATPGEVVRCAAESLAMRYRQSIEQLEAITGKCIKRLHLVGGGSRDVLLNQFAANAIRRPVITGPVEATAIGNILGQAVAVGAVDSLESARELVARSFETTEYEPRDTAAWDAAYQRFLKLAP